MTPSKCINMVTLSSAFCFCLPILAAQKVAAEFENDKVSVTSTSGQKLYMTTDIAGGRNMLLNHQGTATLIEPSTKLQAKSSQQKYQTIEMSANSIAKVLPSQFKDNLIYLTPKLEDGTPLQIFTDTGGGWNAISKELSEKYEWSLYEKVDEKSSMFVTDMPKFSHGAAIPLAGLNNRYEGKLQVIPKVELSNQKDIDGYFGGLWHAEKIIDFNYPLKHISDLDTLPNTAKFTKVDLGFQKDLDGNYITAFPSIDIEVDGKIIPMLFDTGASAWPTDEAREILSLDGTQVATSFIVAAVFDEWVKKHPQWLVIDNACAFSKAPMIRVPKIKLGDQFVGPVWFTKRADHNFHNFMSSMMDRRIDGALGGSALQYLRIIVDYPNAAAYVENSM